MRLSILCLLFTLGFKPFAQTLRFSVNPGHVAFYGFENPIQIENPVKTRLYAIDTYHCKTYQRNGQYYIRPVYKFGNDSCKIVARTTDKKVLHIDTLTIHIKAHETGRASIGESNNYISKEKLMAADSLFLVPELEYFSRSVFNIVKYRVFIIPKAGYMAEMSCNGNKIPTQLKDLFEKLNPGDIIVFDGIRVRSYNNSIEKPISPIAITISAKSYNAHASNYRIDGFIRHSNGQLQAYTYPKTSDEVLLNDVIKDSTWRYYKYDYIKDTFELDLLETYEQGRIRTKTDYYYDSFCHHYTIKYIDDGGDSLFWFEQYYNNGQLYQKGLVVCNTRYSEYRHFKYSNEDNLKVNKPYNVALEHLVSENFHPYQYWQVYDRKGNLSMSLDWTFLEDTSYHEACSFGSDSDLEDLPYKYIKKKYYYSVPNGLITLYNEKGEIIDQLLPD